MSTSRYPTKSLIPINLILDFLKLVWCSMINKYFGKPLKAHAHVCVCVCVCVCEMGGGEGEGGRERERETDRQTDTEKGSLEFCKHSSISC
jgi:hypothetical protein